MQRKAGVLCPVFSIPSNQGIGDFGLKVEKWINHIADAGYSIWQILPLQITGPTHSPYQTLSCFAGDPIYINLDRLSDMGLIPQTSIKNCNKYKTYVDYDRIRAFKEPYFKKAFETFKKNFSFFAQAYEEFEKEAFWLEDWAMYSLFRRLHDDSMWTTWDLEYRDWHEGQYGIDLSEYEDELLYIKFLQFVFYYQWDMIRKAAHEHGITIMGDVPFYVDLDSVDVWSHRKDFLLDHEGNPSFVAGCPPDYFSETGQRWGMPIYDFDAQQEDCFNFWTHRMAWMHRCYDTVRIDHFRAFDTYWKIPVSCPTAVDGHWVEAPGYDLIRQILKTTPDINLIAEDLGIIRQEVIDLEDHFKIPGMDVLLFRLEAKKLKEPAKLHSVVYTGTHDNAPVLQDYNELSTNQKSSLRRFFRRRGYTHRLFSDLLCHYALDCEAQTTILPIWDICGYKEESRINCPGTISEKNWTWRLKDFKTFPEQLMKTRPWLEMAGRIQKGK